MSRVPDARLFLARYRRVLAAGSAGIAVAAGLAAVQPPHPDTVPIWVAARDLPAGHALDRGDLRRVAWPRTSVPDGALDDLQEAEAQASATTLTARMRRGEPLTDARLVDEGILHGLPDGDVVAAVEPSDASMTTVIRPGDRIDVLAGPVADDTGYGTGTAGEHAGASGEAELVLTDVLVLSVVDPSRAAGRSGLGSLGSDSGYESGSATAQGPVLLVDLEPEQARRLAAVTGRRPLTMTLEGRSTT